MWEYYDNGLAKNFESYTLKGEFDFAQTYEYNDNNRVIKLKEYTEDGLLSCWIDTVYDENDNIIKETGYYGDGSLMRLREWGHEPDGNSSYNYMDYFEDGILDVALSNKTEKYNGKYKRMTFYNTDGSVAWISEFESRGYYEVKRYFPDGSLCWSREIVERVYEPDCYDSNPGISTITQYNSDGCVEYTINYNEGYSEVNLYYPDGKIAYNFLAGTPVDTGKFEVQQTAYYYDENGKLDHTVERIFDEDGKCADGGNVQVNTANRKEIIEWENYFTLVKEDILDEKGNLALTYEKALYKYIEREGRFRAWDKNGKDVLAPDTRTSSNLYISPDGKFRVYTCPFMFFHWYYMENTLYVIELEDGSIYLSGCTKND